MSSITLFDIDKDYLNVCKKIEDAEGELTKELEIEYNAVCEALIKKSESYLAVDKHFDSQIEAGKQLISKFQAKLKSLENRKNHLRNMLLTHMEITGKEEILTDLGKIKLQKSSRVINCPVTDVPEKYQKSKVTVTIDKTQLKKDAKNDPELAKFIEDTFFINIY